MFKVCEQHDSTMTTETKCISQKEIFKQCLECNLKIFNK